MTTSEFQFRGDFIDGGFRAAGDGRPFVSENPAVDNRCIMVAHETAGRVDEAVSSATRAAPGWRRAPLSQRIDALRAVQAKVPDHAERIAEAITLEMGKPIAEARVEARSIAGKIDGVIAQLNHELPEAPPSAPGEQRFHALGVVGIIGPFNFPVHLLNTHVIPALLTGNAVVINPSERTPLSGQRYMTLFEDAGFPPGVLNCVFGTGHTGAEIVNHPGTQGIVFTGSYSTGRAIRQATFDMPFKKVSLELGGKNPAVVLDDADLNQAVREIILGALLTTGQRCTATSRVIATKGIASALRTRLVDAFQRIEPGDPMDLNTFMGPLASATSLETFLTHLSEARSHGARVLVESRRGASGAFVTPGMYEVGGDETFLQAELFGPHIAFEVAESSSDAFSRAANTPFGLSAALFSRSAEALEDFYDEVRAGVINFNRSTNGASGLLPFGGTGMSGNWRPAGSCAPRLSTYPVAFMKVDYGHVTAHGALERQLAETSA
ncbi:MAG: aldehyde dehydrogenase family protein [Myxococcota bacterium]|nr:aldehyde dehydrogenase family protein [Myxococcota bacterium]